MPGTATQPDILNPTCIGYKCVIRMRIGSALTAYDAAITVCAQSMNRMNTSTDTPSATPRLQCLAPYADRAVRIDASEPDPLWQTAQPYELSVPQDRATSANASPQEPGTVRFLWNEQALYLAADFVDSDVVAGGSKDGELHYQLGDLVELFLWPTPSSWYWELYGTPHGLQTTLFFHPPSLTNVEDANITSQVRLEVSAMVDGTLNDSHDRDRGFRVEMMVPATELTRDGDTWEANAPWRVLVGRYNYSRWLPQTELSALPQLSATNFHLRDEYADLILQPAR